jgi:hypothetical protein
LEALRAGKATGFAPTRGPTGTITRPGAKTFKDPGGYGYQEPEAAKIAAKTLATQAEEPTGSITEVYGEEWAGQARQGLSEDWIRANVNPKTGKTYAEEKRARQDKKIDDALKTGFVPAESYLQDAEDLSLGEKISGINEQIAETADRISGTYDWKGEQISKSELIRRLKGQLGRERAGTTTGTTAGEAPTGDVPQAPDVAPPSTIDYGSILKTIETSIGKRSKQILDKLEEYFPTEGTFDAEAKINALYPELPQRVTEIDTELASLWNRYQTLDLEAEQRLAPMSFIRGEKAIIERQYNIEKQTLLMEREAMVGDYERAVDRAKTVLDLETEYEKEQRENKMFAVQYLMDQANEEERRLYEVSLLQLQREQSLADEKYEAKQSEIDDIQKIVSATPEAFIGKGWPKSVEKALRIVGEWNAKAEVPTTKVVGGELYQWNPSTKAWEVVAGAPATRAGRSTLMASLRSDVDAAISTGDYPRLHPTRDDLVNVLVENYPELSRADIVSEVYLKIAPPGATQAGQTPNIVQRTTRAIEKAGGQAYSFFSSLFKR